MSRLRALWLALVCLQPYQPAHVVTIVLPAGLPLTPGGWTYSPSWAVEHARTDHRGQLQLEVHGAVQIQHPALCPIELAGSDTIVAARSRLQVHGATAQVGYDAPIELRAELPCAERATVRWRQVEGEKLDAWQLTNDGRTLHARTLPVKAFYPDALPAGLVAVSPRTQGRYVVEATLEEPGRLPRTQRVTVTSIARATGMTSLAVDQAVMLGSEGWHVETRPRGSEAQVQNAQGVHTFRADQAGSYRLVRAEGAALELRVLTHERTPMDCGRAECHAAEASFAARSPMSHALERATGGVLDLSRGDGCMLGCHTTGELGIEDGGFSQLMHELALTPLHARPIAELPRPLQRLAGVGCTACHGPGAIPTLETRARILRADVCATCHDAPPRYEQVSQWRHSAMAHADADPRVRAEPRCAGCHTTGGFLDRIGVRKRDDLSRDPDGLQIGLSCVVCHAPHGKTEGKALLRSVSDDAPVCASCHAPQPDELLPSGSAFTLLSGKVQLPDALGATKLEHTSAHRALACTDCHGAGGAKLDHSFQVSAEVCTNCHRDGPTLDSVRADAQVLRLEVQALRSTLAARCKLADEGPLHASTPRCDERAASALYLLALVAEDSGAAWHNASFARALLSRARSLL